MEIDLKVCGLSDQGARPHTLFTATTLDEHVERLTVESKPASVLLQEHRWLLLTNLPRSGLRGARCVPEEP